MVLLTMLAVACSYPGGSIEAPQQLVLANPAGKGSRLPRLVPMPDKTSTLMSWVEPTGNGHALKFAILQGERWVRQGVASQGENWFINWADYPSVVPVSDTFWVAHWLSRRQGGKRFDYDVSLSITNDAGKTWREIGHPHRDNAAAEHGFVTIFKESDHAAGIVWLDGREYAKKSEVAQQAEKSGNFALRYTRIYADGSMDDEQVIDDNTCTCCSTSVAQTPAGAIALWRGRTQAEIRDNRYALLVKGKWTSPSELGDEGWQIDACPVNGPSVASRGKQVVASWYTAQGDQPRVRLAFSADSGKSFDEPMVIDDNLPLGRMGLVWLDSQHAVASWLGKTHEDSKKSDLNIRLLDKTGKVYVVQRIATLSGGRDTGVPQMVSNGDELIFAWTNPVPEYGITTVRLPKKALKKELLSAHINKTIYLADNLKTWKAMICTQNHPL
jgi:hypothetical protein